MAAKVSKSAASHKVGTAKKLESIVNEGGVRFCKNGFTVTFLTDYPVEDYLNVCEDIIMLMQSGNAPLSSFMLLRSLLPAPEEAAKMAAVY